MCRGCLDSVIVEYVNREVRGCVCGTLGERANDRVSGGNDWGSTDS
jgi:hypothetical protein